MSEINEISEDNRESDPCSHANKETIGEVINSMKKLYSNNRRIMVVFIIMSIILFLFALGRLSLYVNASERIENMNYILNAIKKYRISGELEASGYIEAEVNLIDALNYLARIYNNIFYQSIILIVFDFVLAYLFLRSLRHYDKIFMLASNMNNNESFHGSDPETIRTNAAKYFAYTAIILFIIAISANISAQFYFDIRSLLIMEKYDEAIATFGNGKVPISLLGFLLRVSHIIYFILLSKLFPAIKSIINAVKLSNKILVLPVIPLFYDLVDSIGAYDTPPLLVVAFGNFIIILVGLGVIMGRSKKNWKIVEEAVKKLTTKSSSRE